MNNKQKVTVELRNGKFRLPNGSRLEELNPKALLLCATAQCAGYTVMGILNQDHITPKRLELTIEGTEVFVKELCRQLILVTPVTAVLE